MTVSKISGQTSFAEGERGEVNYQVDGYSDGLVLLPAYTLLGSAEKTEYSFDVDPVSGLVTISISVPADIERLGEVQYELTLEDATGDSVVLTDTISITNPSGEEKYVKLLAYQENLEEFLTLAEPVLLLERVETLSLMLNPEVDNGETETSSQSKVDALYASTDSQLESDLKTSLFDAVEVISGYENLVYSETDIDTLLNEVGSIMASFMEPVILIVESELMQVSEVIPPLSMQELYIDPTTGLISLFVGNPSLGEYNDGIWEFSPHYAFLEQISFPYTATCNAE
jgi:dsDNA-binding SOS-regulon protein